MFEPSGIQRQGQIEVEDNQPDQAPQIPFEDLQNRLLSLQKDTTHDKPSSLQECIAEMPANYSRNNNQHQINKKVI